MIKVLFMLLAVILGLEIINENPIAFFIISAWLSLISFGLYTKRRNLLKFIAPGYSLDNYKPVQFKIMIGTSLLFLAFGLSEIYLW